MTSKEIIEGLKLLEDNMVYFDKLLNDKGEYIDVHELLFESIEALSAEPCEGCDYKEWLKGEVEPKTDVLDKIKAEIKKNILDMCAENGTNAEMSCYNSGLLKCLEIIDKYKAESEDKE